MLIPPAPLFHSTDLPLLLHSKAKPAPKIYTFSMEELEDMKKSCCEKNSIRRRRKSLSTNTHLDPLINMADARRDIVNALHLHRLLSSSSWESASRTVGNGACASQSFYYQLMDSMPIPEPTWSTTAPTVLCAPVLANSVEVVEFEWPESIMSSSYTWWMGLLNSLDGKGNGEVMVKNSKGFGQSCSDDSNSSVEKSYLDHANLDDESLFLDDWLIFPAAEDQG